ncbi:hypothetical protein, partial [Paraburkholderia sp. SIMBA_054]|uniref:hypothetical protein n=1 Tax=Paraburkholderia sp. SIMBA_054 TaxID=3085795 RepID=UPI00397C46EC
MRRSLALFLLLAGCLVPALAAAQADLRTEGDVARAQGTYEAEVPVNSQGEGDRAGALARALGSV